MERAYGRIYKQQHSRVFSSLLLLRLLCLIHTNGSKVDRLSHLTGMVKCLLNWQKTVSFISEHNTMYALGACKHSIILLVSLKPADRSVGAKTENKQSSSVQPWIPTAPTGFRAGLDWSVFWSRGSVVLCRLRFVCISDPTDVIIEKKTTPVHC